VAVGAEHAYRLENFTAVEATSPPAQVHGRDALWHPIAGELPCRCNVHLARSIGDALGGVLSNRVLHRNGGAECGASKSPACSVASSHARNLVDDVNATAIALAAASLFGASKYP
jgi:hypothetical protein